MKTEEELIWEAYQPKLIRESLSREVSDEELIEMYKDAIDANYDEVSAILDVAKDAKINPKDLNILIRRYKSTSTPPPAEDVYDEFGLTGINTGENVSADPSLRTDTSDKPNGSEFDSGGQRGSEVTAVQDLKKKYATVGRDKLSGRTAEDQIRFRKTPIKSKKFG